MVSLFLLKDNRTAGIGIKKEKLIMNFSFFISQGEKNILTRVFL